MATAQELKAQIGSVQDLQSVVKTMKALAAVSIRQYQKAHRSLEEYYRTVEMGLHILMRKRYLDGESAIPPSLTDSKSPPPQGLVAIVFGSDQGLCGQFNQQIASHAIAQFEELDLEPENLAIAAAGARVTPSLEAAGYSVEDQSSVPRSVTEITSQVQDVLLTIQQWQEERSIDRVIIFYNQPTSGSSYRSESQQLLPLDLDWLCELQEKEWHRQVIPTFTMNWQQLFSALIRQYLFASLYRAFAASLASENASRLSSMQSAEKNIEERLSDLNSEHRRLRQTSITAELLDVVAGFEALTSP